MKYAAVCRALATVGSLVLLNACLETEPAQVGTVSEAGGFVEPERRLAVEGEESYCGAEVLRWRYDPSSGSLTVADSRLLLNCCGQRVMHVDRIDSIYEITERDEPDATNPRCDSVCAFDFAVAIPEVAPRKIYVRLLRDVVDAQGSAELIWQGEIDVRKLSGEVVDHHLAGRSLQRIVPVGARRSGAGAAGERGLAPKAMRLCVTGSAAPNEHAAAPAE